MYNFPDKIHEPGDILRMMYRPPFTEGVEFPIEAMVIRTTLCKDGSVEYWVSIPDVDESELPESADNGLFTVSNTAYRMSGGSTTVDHADLPEEGAYVRHSYSRERRDRRVREGKE